jgi:tyrosinase-like protein/Big-like domain-containing protein
MLFGLVLVTRFVATGFAAADLWIRDDVNDVGNEPNNQSPVYYLSDDIWVRRLADPNYDPHPFLHNNPTWVPLPHEGPCYRDPKTSSPNYMYVRIRNRGNTASSGNETLHVYWAKASTGLSWPGDWNDHLDNPCGGADRLYGYEVTKPRKSGAAASNTERTDYVTAIQTIDTASFQFPDGVTYFDKQDFVHQYVFQGINNVHYTLGFFPWHREFMNRYEACLREVKPALTLLYWDWTTDPSPTILGNAGFMGASSGAVGAPFPAFGLTRSKPSGAPGAAGLQPSYQTMTILPSANFSAVWNNTEGPAHDSAHCYLGGTVCSFNAARDPMFFMIHANADRIWALWQRQNVNRWTPSQAYDANQASAAITADFKPWDGSGSISPWLNQIPGDPEGYIIHKSPLHHSIVYPPIYDDALLRVPVLQPNECAIIEIPFYPPPLNECNGFQDPQHLCLLARIEPVSVAEGASVWNNVKNNNNIAWRNVTLSDCSVGPFFLLAPGRIGAAGELIRNLREQPAAVTLRFDAVRTGFRTLFNFGPLRLRLEDNLMRAWIAGGRQGQGIEVAGNNELLVFGTGATLANLQMEKRELGRMDLALELNPNYQHPFGDVFHLDVLQFDDQGGAEPVGGQRYTMDFNLLRIVGKGSDWKFLDAGKVPGSDWTRPEYDDGDWMMGTAPFGYGRSDVATGLRGNAANQATTAYFRQAFHVADPAFYRNLDLNFLQDDGIAVYLNGQEIARFNLPTGPLTPETPALVPVTGAAARACRSFDISQALELLQRGRNVLAAEVHPGRIAGGSNRVDMTFDVELAGNVPDAPYQPPTVVVDTPQDGARVRFGADVPIVADVLDPDGDLAEVRIYGDGQLLARLTESPFRAAFLRPALGSHRVSVEAQDIFAHITRMESVFTVVSNLLPVVQVTAPAADIHLAQGTPVTLAASAFDLDGTVQRVNFYVKPHNRFDSLKTLVGSSATTPYTAQAHGLPPDRYLALAEAVDDSGAVGYSLSSHFVVEAASIHIRLETVGGARRVWLEWDHPGALLETASGLAAATWQPLTGAASPYPVQPNQATQFFRLSLPAHQH